MCSVISYILVLLMCFFLLHLSFIYISSQLYILPLLLILDVHIPYFYAVILSPFYLSLFIQHASLSSSSFFFTKGERKGVSHSFFYIFFLAFFCHLERFSFF